MSPAADRGEWGAAVGTCRMAKAERRPMPTNVTAKQLGDRPAYPCALPFEHGDRCGMSTHMTTMLAALPRVIAYHAVICAELNANAIADDCDAIANALLEREAAR